MSVLVYFLARLHCVAHIVHIVLIEAFKAADVDLAGEARPLAIATRPRVTYGPGGVTDAADSAAVVPRCRMALAEVVDDFDSML